MRVRVAHDRERDEPSDVLDTILGRAYGPDDAPDAFVGRSVVLRVGGHLAHLREVLLMYASAVRAVEAPDGQRAFPWFDDSFGQIQYVGPGYQMRFGHVDPRPSGPLEHGELVVGDRREPLVGKLDDPVASAARCRKNEGLSS